MTVDCFYLQRKMATCSRFIILSARRSRLDLFKRCCSQTKNESFGDLSLEITTKLGVKEESEKLAQLDDAVKTVIDERQNLFTSKQFYNFKNLMERDPKHCYHWMSVSL